MACTACGSAAFNPTDVPPGATDSDDPFIHQDGTRLRDRSGAEVSLHAVNLGGWLLWEGWIWGGGIQSEGAIRAKLDTLLGVEEERAFAAAVHQRFIADADLERISALGFNAVRVPLNARIFEGSAGLGGPDAEGWAVLDALIASCEAHGLVAILDLHSAPGGQSAYFMADPGQTSLWRSDDAQDATVALWRAIAERYRNRSGVGGYDLLNEPDPLRPDQLFSLYRRIAAAIREVDVNHLVIVEGSSFATDFSLFSAPVTFNQAYSFHQYVWVGDSRQEELDRYRAISEAHRIPMWNGEFGVNSVELIRSSRALYVDPANGLSGFGFWTWKETPQDQPGLAVMDAPLPRWQRVFGWVTGAPWTARPSVEEARAGLNEFLDAAALEHCTVNPEMVDALRGTP